MVFSNGVRSATRIYNVYINKSNNVPKTPLLNDQTFFKTKLISANKESILINLFSNWILYIYCKMLVCGIFLIKLYFKATNIIHNFGD